MDQTEQKNTTENETISEVVKIKPPRKRSKKRLCGVRQEYEYLEFVRWWAMPEPLRIEIRTQTEFAKKYNLHQDTLTDWKKREEFRGDVIEATKEWARDKTPNVIMGLYRKAVKDGTAQEAKLWLQWVLGETFDAPQTQVNIQNNILSMTDEQLQQAISREITEIKELQSRLGTSSS